MLFQQPIICQCTNVTARPGSEVHCAALVQAVAIPAHLVVAAAVVGLLESCWALLPGVVGWVGPEDIPAGPQAMVTGSFTGPQEQLFAWQEVAYLGQPLGLVLARSTRAALAGAAAVQAHYEQQQQQEDGSRTTAAGVLESNCDPGTGSTGDGCSAAAAAGAGGALTTLAAAIAAGSWYDISKLPTKADKGAVQVLNAVPCFLLPA
jgi:xanthine dehydrogenase molybdopterin-binding subunit B